MSDSNKDLNNQENNVLSNEESVNSMEAADKTPAASVDNITSTDENDLEDIEILSASDVDNSDDDIPDEPETTAKPKKPQKIYNIIRYAVIGVSICVFLYAFVNIVIIVYNYTHAQDIYNNVENNVASLSYETQSYVDDDGNTYDNISASSQIDFETLKSINNSVVGWISFPAVNIEYPIVQAADNDFYLTHAINYEDSYSGAIFLDYRTNSDLSDPHMMIYGHHMQDGSMFAGLLEYDSEDFYKANAKNNYFYIYTEENVKVYEVWSVCDVTFAANPQAFSVSSPVSEYTAYVESLELYDTGVEVNENDQICTLYTCKTTSEAKVRQLVHGRLVTILENTTE